MLYLQFTIFFFEYLFYKISASGGPLSNLAIFFSGRDLRTSDFCKHMNLETSQKYERWSPIRVDLTGMHTSSEGTYPL